MLCVYLHFCVHVFYLNYKCHKELNEIKHKYTRVTWLVSLFLSCVFLCVFRIKRASVNLVNSYLAYACVHCTQRLDRNPIISNIICNNRATHRLRMKYEKNIILARRMRFRQTYRIRSFLWWHLIYRFWLELQSSFLPRLTLRTGMEASNQFHKTTIFGNANKLFSDKISQKNISNIHLRGKWF